MIAVGFLIFVLTVKSGWCHPIIQSIAPENFSNLAKNYFRAKRLPFNTLRLKKKEIPSINALIASASKT